MQLLMQVVNIKDSRFCSSAKFPANQLREIIQDPPKSPFKRLLLETLLWQCATSTTYKTPPEGLKDSECKKGMLTVRPPILYIPPIDLHEKRDTE
jgi:hypothetical protein